MKSHKYWSLGALFSMIGTFYTGYKNMKSAHKYFACSSLICMIMSIYSGHKMISGNPEKEKHLLLKKNRNNNFSQDTSLVVKNPSGFFISLFRFRKRWFITFVC